MRNNELVIVSTSYREYDRRLLRIISALEEVGYQITWLSRSVHSKSKKNIIRTWFTSGIAFYLEFNVRATFKLLQWRMPTIYAVDLDTLLASRLAQLITKSRLIFDAHEYFSEVPELSGKPVKKWIWSSIGKSCLSENIHCITVNTSLQTILSEKYSVDFEVVRNVPEANQFGNQTQIKDQKQLVYLGAVNVGRGVELLCQAIQTLDERYSLKVIGDGDNLASLVNSYGGHSRILFTGYVSPEHIGNEMKDAWLAFNLLEANSLNYYYSLTNKYFDYMHAGLPSVHMEFPEYSYLNEQYQMSYLAKTYSVSAIQDAITYFETGENYKNAQEACSQAAQNFTWEKEKIKLQKLFRDWEI